MRPPDGSAAGTQPRTELPPIDLPPRPVRWPRLPEVGDAYDFGSDRKPLHVPRGLQIVAQPGPAICGLGGSSTVFIVNGEPAEFLESYVGLGGAWRRDVKRSERTQAGANVVQAHWTNGRSFDAELVSRPGRPTLLLLDHCPAD